MSILCGPYLGYHELTDEFDLFDPHIQIKKVTESTVVTLAPGYYVLREREGQHVDIRNKSDIPNEHATETWEAEGGRTKNSD